MAVAVVWLAVGGPVPYFSALAGSMDGSGGVAPATGV